MELNLDFSVNLSMGLSVKIFVFNVKINFENCNLSRSYSLLVAVTHTEQTHQATYTTETSLELNSTVLSL